MTVIVVAGAPAVAAMHPRAPGGRIPGMRVHVRPALLLPMLLGFVPAAHATVLETVGDARAPGDNRLLYREQHLIRRDGDRPLERLVIYRCPDGTAFARKRVDYRASTLAPDFDLVDARGYREGLRRENGQARVWHDDGAARPLAGSDATLVADAGFDEFIRQRWAALAPGRTQTLAFAIPAFGRSLGFKVHSAGDRAPALRRFELKAGGMLGLVAPAITVDYDVRDRRLRRFTGPTNIRDAKGRQFEARIEFPAAPRDVDDEAQWRQLSAVPLKPCTPGG